MNDLYFLKNLYLKNFPVTKLSIVIQAKPNWSPPLNRLLSLGWKASSALIRDLEPKPNQFRVFLYFSLCPMPLPGIEMTLFLYVLPLCTSIYKAGMFSRCEQCPLPQNNNTLIAYEQSRIKLNLLQNKVFFH